MKTRKTDTVIIGAGPYGLSVAAHLKATGADFEIYGTPLESWRSFMPEGMFLRSEPFASNLWDPERRFTFEKYCARRGLAYQPVDKPVSLALFLEYADWFRENAVGPVRDIRVTKLRKAAGGGFVLEASDGAQVRCRHVVLATGHMPFREKPAAVAGLPPELCIHSAELRDVKAYAGRDVTIIGRGQSALETAALAHEAGARVRLLVRSCHVKWNPPSTKAERGFVDRITRPEAGLGSGWAILAITELPRVFRYYFGAEKRHRFVKTAWGPSGSRWLRERVDGKVDILLKHEITRAEAVDGRVRLTLRTPDGEKQLVTDRVIAATGFKIDLARLAYLDPALRAEIELEGESVPKLNARFETSVPGLFLIGIATAPSYGPVMRFMFGGKHVAPVIAAHLSPGLKGQLGRLLPRALPVA